MKKLDRRHLIIDAARQPETNVDAVRQFGIADTAKTNIQKSLSKLISKPAIFRLA
jgi:hypothetical protein